MMSLANSLIYQRLFQQTDSGEKVHEGSAAEKAVTYDLGVKGIPDDVVWALSAVNLDQYDVPQWVQASNHPIFYLPDFWLFTIFSVFFGIHVISKTRQIYDRAKNLTITWWSEKIENYAQQGRRQSEHVLEAAWWRAKAWNGKKITCHSSQNPNQNWSSAR